MTREEIVHEYEDAVAAHAAAAAAGIKGAERSYELFMAGLHALRPITKEQVEKAWRGKWERKNGKHTYTCSRCGVDTLSRFKPDESLLPFSWCPVCGAPMTDEAVQMVMERLEALHEKN